MKREALSHPVAIAGVLITTASAVVFCALVIAMFTGMLVNPYAGLVVFVALPACFLLGLLLIPIGARLQRKRLARHPGEAPDWPVIDFRRADVRRTTVLITALTAVNIVILLLAGYGSLHWMESPSFCGRVCHTPMQPQFASWRHAAHGGVACVECHIGEGAGAFVHAKLSGVRQLLQVAGNSYPRPIPPGAQMPEGAQAQACRRCHQPERNVGDRVRVIREYADDEANTETMTVMHMHVSATPSSPRRIHWHADPDVRIEYIASDDKGETIPYVKLTDARGHVKEFVAPDTPQQLITSGTRKRMDCIDCHNAVGHPISQTPERAVDQAMAAGQVSRSLPFARREGVRLMKASYPTHEAADRGIEQGLREFYRSQSHNADHEQLKQSVRALQDLYRRNVFPDMNVTWGSYPDNRGHITSNGCVRCHDDSHTAKDGSTIGGDCEYCHTQVR
jgi:hypothetical protein